MNVPSLAFAERLRLLLRNRLLASPVGTLLLLVQRSPLVQMLLPEAKLISSSGAIDVAAWAVATVAGLGAYDSVSGATTISQISPNSGSTSVPATKGKNLSFVFQLLGYPDTPGSWKVTGLPSGLTHADVKNNTVDSVSGVPTQTGTFSVKITAYSKTSYSGDNFSKTFTMTVADDPSARITSQPSSTTINSGQSATLSVSAGGASPFTYKWYRGAKGNTSNPVGGNSANYTTPALTATTTYWVNVSNSDNPSGEKSNAATVTVNQPARITNQPDSTTINSGQSTTLSVSASGTAPLTYQWYRGASGSTANPVGTNSPNFTTPVLTTTTSYWVKVTNVANTSGDLSDTATVTVNQPASVATPPASVSINSGASVVLSVVAAGTPPFSYQWYQGVSGDTAVPVGSDSPDLTTPSLAADTSYWVRVTNASNPAGADSAAALVTVVQPAAVATAPQPATVASGGTAILHVIASGTGPFTYQWYAGETGDTSRPVGVDSPDLTTDPLAASESYWVRITNAANPSGADSPSALVAVLGDRPALIESQPQAVTIVENTSTTLSVGAGGLAPFTYQWYQGASGDTSQPVGTDAPDFTTPALASTTSYWVHVSNPTNPAGVDSETAIVTVDLLVAASITTDPVSAFIASGNTATLSVLAAGTAPLSYQWYEGASGDTSTPVGTDSASFTTPALDASASYWVRVSNAVNPAGADSAAAVVSIGEPVSINVPPGAVSINYGGTAELSVVATGTGPLDFQWYLGESGDTSTPVGGDSDTFTTPALFANATYWVRVSNPVVPQGIDSDSALVSVGAFVPVSFTAEPASTVVKRGETATLTASASGSDPITYQWFEGASGDTGTPVGGGLSITTPLIEAPKEYWVRVSNGGSSVDSGTVHVSSAPMIVIELPNGDVLPFGKGSVNFARVLTGASAERTLVIRNAGAVDLTGLSLGVSGPNAADFTTTGPLQSDLAAGQTTSFQVTFAPAAKGSRNARLAVDTTVPGERSFDLGLVGTASVPVPEIDVRNGKANLNDGKSSINCGKANVGKKSKPVTLTIANSGTAALTGLKVAVQGKSAKDFKVSQPKLKSLAPGRSTTFKLTFKPKAKGKRKAVLRIGSNDSNENPFDLKLKAKATP